MPTPPAGLINADVFDAVRYRVDGTVQITVQPEDSDDVIIEIDSVLDPAAAEAAIVAAFTELGRRVAAQLTEE
jgi:hypothetical protein